MNNLDSNAQEPVELSDLDLPRSQRVSMPAWARRFMQRWQVLHSRRRLRKISSAGLVLAILLIILLLSGNSFFSLVASQLRTGFGLFQQTVPQTHSSSLLNVSPPLIHVHGQDGIACLLDAQWSPAGDAIAVLGYAYNCPNNHDVPGILNIYNAHTGKLIAQWQPDDTILTVMDAPTIENQGASTLGVLATSSYQMASSGSANVGSTRLLPFSYIHVMWSPDGQRLALSFIVYMQQQPFFGILEMKINGHSSRVIFQPPNLNQGMPIEWDFATGQALGFTRISPAIAYRWGPHGALIPEMPLSDNAVQPVPLPGPVGNPDGNAAFTIWQPGFTRITNVAGYYKWGTIFSAWSPDGRYLIDDIDLQGLFKPPGSLLPNAHALSNLMLLHYKRLLPRDVALLQAADGFPVISWRPDGHILATYAMHGSVILYDSRTGHALETLKLPANQPLLAGSLALLRWSPDGSHLLLSSTLNGLVNIWGSGQLPQA
ncbi:MAG TPA: WD40 repeat domain-containing protein [Ktedonobacteraceae bacterium]|nr:WD40 repeat domain-containing protein [Ktedonobacteraceae bacterium]